MHSGVWVWTWIQGHEPSCSKWQVFYQYIPRYTCPLQLGIYFSHHGTSVTAWSCYVCVVFRSSMSPRALLLNIGGQPVVLLMGGGTFRRWGLLERKLGYLGCVLEGDVRILAPLPFSLSWLLWVEQFSSTTCSLLVTDQRQLSPVILDRNLRTLSWKNPSYKLIFLSCFVTVMESWLIH